MCNGMGWYDNGVTDENYKNVIFFISSFSKLVYLIPIYNIQINSEWMIDKDK
jgi:hypothetical protein